MADFWTQALSFGEQALESLGEGASNVLDAFVDYKSQQIAAEKTDQQTIKDNEPVKGQTTTGQPIIAGASNAEIAAAQSSSVDMNTLLLVGGGLVGVVLLAFVLKK